MPKNIENVREMLLEEAKKQIAENGYSKMTIRSVAGKCNLGVGTVYNYFKSKDMLIASFMADDWKECLETINSQTKKDSKSVLFSIYKALTSFSERHNKLFCDKDAVKVFSTVFSERHKQLRNQLAKLITPICDKSSVEDKAYLSEFIAESLLCWTVAGKDFEEQYKILSQLLK